VRRQAAALHTLRVSETDRATDNHCNFTGTTRLNFRQV
jgi:hypothetical protein